MIQTIELTDIQPGQEVIVIGPDKCANCGSDLVSQATITNTRPAAISIPVAQPGRVIFHCPFCSTYFGRCAHCGDEFEAARPWAKFCGVRCRVANWRENNQGESEV